MDESMDSSLASEEEGSPSASMTSADEQLLLMRVQKEKEFSDDNSAEDLSQPGDGQGRFARSAGSPISSHGGNNDARSPSPTNGNGDDDAPPGQVDSDDPSRHGEP
jgi:hypothetical protein